MAADTATGPHQSLREEAALRRVAILAAGEATETEVFSAVTAEASDLLAPAHVQILRAAGREDLDRAVARLVVEAGGPGRATCVPVVVAGETWGGLVAVAASGRPLSTSATARLSDFAQLVASAVAARRAGNELRSLAEQQGALRRVATLVAQGAEREQLFEAIAEEISRILGVKAISLVEYDAATGMLTQKAATHGGRAAVQRYGALREREGAFLSSYARTLSNGSLRFHTDRCDVIALMCVRNGIEGGVSKLASIPTIHNEMLRRRPDLVSPGPLRHVRTTVKGTRINAWIHVPGAPQRLPQRAGQFGSGRLSWFRPLAPRPCIRWRGADGQLRCDWQCDPCDEPARIRSC